MRSRFFSALALWIYTKTEVSIKHSLTSAVSDHLTYVFDKGTLMLEGVTLAEVIQFMVQMFVYFACCSVFDKKAA